MKVIYIFVFFTFLTFNFCTRPSDKNLLLETDIQDTIVQEQENVIDSVFPDDIIIEKELLYDQHTLADEYPYRDTTRIFQWDKIKERLALVENIQKTPSTWAILQNYKNQNKEAPLVKEYKRNAYKRIADTFGVERYQSVPLFSLTDTVTGERYGRDGSLVRYLGETGGFDKVETTFFEGQWYVPKRYVKNIGDTLVFNHVIFIDLTNQNIATLEKVDSTWMVRSMNPATSGVHRPPYAQETPVGLFVIQEKKYKMIFLRDGSTETGGFAPYASRFTNGAYIHGVPVNVPRTTFIEFSSSLGTTPRSHMCVRNATSHAKFVYDNYPVRESLVFIFE